MKVAMIVPGIGNDPTVSTPVINTLVAHLGQEVELHVFPVQYPTAGDAFALGPAMVHPVDRSDMRLRRLVASTIAKLYREHRKTRFDLVHGLWLFPPGAIAVLAGRLLGVPSIVSIGGAEVVAIPDIHYGGLLTRKGRAVQRQVLTRASVVTGGSGYILDLAGVVAKRPAGYERAPLPVDPRFRPLAGRVLLADPERPRLLHAAALIPVKDQATLLKAFALVLETLPGAMLDIAGEDPFGHRYELESLAGALGLANTVRFLGSIPHAAMASLYQQADVFLLSSRHESQGMVVLEAAACGLPTVGSAVGVVRDLAPDASVAIAAHAAEVLANAAVNLLRDPERLRRMGAAAQARVEQRYAVIPVTGRFLHLYRAAIERRRR